MGYKVENHCQNRIQDTRYTPNPMQTTSIADLRIGSVRNEAAITAPSDYKGYRERLSPDLTIAHLKTSTTPIQNP